MLILSTFVVGTPRTKGSLTPQKVRAGDGARTGRIRLVDTDESKRWRRVMALEFATARLTPQDGPPWSGPVVVACIFWKAINPLDPLYGDLDKLVRNVYDAMTDARVWDDDRQAVADGGSRKQYGTTEGVLVNAWTE